MLIADVHEVLRKCVDYHGHYCMGQSLGVRIAKKGLELTMPEDRKDLIVFVENDRCIADAVLMATGTRLGRRNLKFVDYGRMAATFFNLKNNLAWRVGLKPTELADEGKDDAKDRVLTMADDELLLWEKVKVQLKEEELPGKPKRIVTCVKCGEKVFDGKDLTIREDIAGPMCRACAFGAYYAVE
ncbi:MAG: formylmethanofuran dehydrogenase subunit E family protein [Geobacteraceae bacterium]